MNQTQQGHHHHVVGAIHEVVVTSDDPDLLRQAIRREVDHCNAHRIVIDLTGLDEISIQLIDTLADASDPDRTRVRVDRGRPTVTIGELHRNA